MAVSRLFRSLQLLRSAKKFLVYVKQEVPKSLLHAGSFQVEVMCRRYRVLCRSSVFGRSHSSESLSCVVVGCFHVALDDVTKQCDTLPINL